MRALVLAIASSLLLAGCAEPDDGDGGGEDAGSGGDSMPAFELLSSAFDDGKPIPRRHTCDGQEASPPLTILGAPDGAKALLLFVTDPDVPTPQTPIRTLNHWVVQNITPGAQVTFPEGGIPAGATDEGNEFGDGYLGPCPPPASAAHRYNLTVHALDVDFVHIPDNATAMQVEAALEGHVIGSARLTGTYQRQLSTASSSPSASATSSGTVSTTVTNTGTSTSTGTPGP